MKDRYYRGEVRIEFALELAGVKAKSAKNAWKKLSELAELIVSSGIYREAKKRKLCYWDHDYSVHLESCQIDEDHKEAR